MDMYTKFLADPSRTYGNTMKIGTNHLAPCLFLWVAVSTIKPMIVVVFVFPPQNSDGQPKVCFGLFFFVLFFLVYFEIRKKERKVCFTFANLITWNKLYA